MKRLFLTLCLTLTPITVFAEQQPKQSLCPVQELKLFQKEIPEMRNCDELEKERAEAKMIRDEIRKREHKEMIEDLRKIYDELYKKMKENERRAESKNWV